MSQIKLKLIPSSAALFLCGLLLGAQPALSSPVALEDVFLEQVTAGNTPEGRGMVVGNSSESASKTSSGINLGGEAQGSIRALNLVNSAESAVANTVNIWDGNSVTITTEDGDIKPVLEVNQVNQVTQVQIQSATLSGYSRPEAEKTEIQRHSVSESYLSKVVDSNNTINILEEISISSTISEVELNTRTKFKVGDKLEFEGNLGQGIAAAGYAKIEIEGGSVDIALVASGGISVGADSADLSQNGNIVVDDPDFGDANIQAGITAEAQVSVIVNLELPKMNIELSGAGCGVVLGSCAASSIRNEMTQTITDNSTQDIVENHQAGQNSFSQEQISITRSSFELESAKAEYIVVDDSSLTLDSDVTLELSESAQKDVEAMNIVNAIGSNVANATNVSRASNFKSLRSTLVLNQFNIVQHGH